jgi:predicted amidohydrolase YtcJ
MRVSAEGLLMEAAFLPIFAQLPKPSPDAQMAALVEGQKIYAAAGVTTAHEGATHIPVLQILQRGAKEGKLFIDAIAYSFITDFNVAPIDQLFVVWSAVNRLSREGDGIGPAERIGAYDALKAVTFNVAYWY